MKLGGYLEVALDVHVFAESGGVVVPGGLGVAEGLQHGIALEEPVPHVVHLVLVQRRGGHEPQDLLARLRLPRATLACKNKAKELVGRKYAGTGTPSNTFKLMNNFKR